MTVRICYLERADRGSSIRRVRLIGQTSQVLFPPEESSTGLEPAAVARWITDQLGQVRDTQSLSLLCLDTDGAVCAWLTSPSTDATVVNVVARSGSAAAGPDDGAKGTAAIEYFAPAMLDSSIEALAEPTDAASTGSFSRRASKNARQTTSSQRMPVLALTEVPARLLIDSLDELGIAVDATASLWHTAALAWDPGWSARPAAAVTSDNGPIQAQTVAGVVATILIDPRGRLIWCWSREGTLLVGGSMRLRIASPVAASTTDEPPAAEPSHAIFGPEEVNRLTAEWLSWSVQTGLSPSQITCIMTEHDPELVAQFGQALGRLWPHSPIDAAMYTDPIAATLSRAAERLEQTPRASDPSVKSGRQLAGLSTRHGREHRQMYVWTALAIAGIALLATMLSVRLRSLASEARERAADVASESAKLVKEHFPDARPGPGYSLLKATSDEVLRLRNLAEPPKRAEPQMPILEELETISMVTGNSNYALESLDLDGGANAVLKLSIVANSLSEAEAMTEALASISGSAVTRWEEPSVIDTTSKPGKFKVNYTAKWAQRDLKTDKKTEKP